MSHSAVLRSATPNLEEEIMYIARVSNPKNQDSGNTGLLRYCMKNNHWSVFEMANIVIEINTSRAIARQILRHRSFSFQEFSQRYSNVNEIAKNYILSEARLQDTKNRQNSIETSDDDLSAWFNERQTGVWAEAIKSYNLAIDKGIAKEQARVLLPEGLTPSRMFMNGTVRSWIHYVSLRCGNGTQKEHQELALQCRDILCEQLPALKDLIMEVGG